MLFCDHWHRFFLCSIYHSLKAKKHCLERVERIENYWNRNVMMFTFFSLTLFFKLFDVAFCDFLDLFFNMAFHWYFPMRFFLIYLLFLGEFRIHTINPGAHSRCCLAYFCLYILGLDIENYFVCWQKIYFSRPSSPVPFFSL